MINQELRQHRLSYLRQSIELFKANQITAAASFLERVCGGESTEPSLTPEEYVSALNLLGKVYARQQKPIQANALFEKASAVASTKLGPASFVMAAILVSRGENSLSGLAYGKARSYLEQAIVILDSGQSTIWRRKHAEANMLMGIVERVTQRFAEAENHGARAAELIAIEPAGVLSAIIYQELAQTYDRQGKFEAGEPWHLKAKVIYEQDGDCAWSSDRASCLVHLAFSYKRRGRVVESEPAYLHALRIYETVGDDNHSYQACLLGYADLLRRSGRSLAADKVFERAEELKRRLI